MPVYWYHYIASLSCNIAATYFPAAFFIAISLLFILITGFNFPANPNCFNVSVYSLAGTVCRLSFFCSIFGAYMKKALVLLTTAFSLLLFLTRCNKTNDVAASTLRVFNIDPRLKAQNMVINGETKLTGVAYNNDSTINIMPGTYNILFQSTGTKTASYNIDFGFNKNYMMFLLNNNDSLLSEVFDASFLPLGPDTSEVRFFNFSPDAPTMDIGFKNTDTSTLDTTYKYYQGRSFNDVYVNRIAYSVFRTIPSGTHWFKMYYNDSTKVFDSVLLTFANRKSYTIVAHGLYSSTGADSFKVSAIVH